MNHSSDTLECEGPSGDLLTAINYSLIAYLALATLATLAILLFTYFEAKKKFEQLENAYGPGYDESLSDSSEFEDRYYEDEDMVDISDMYEVIPEDIQKKEERRRKRFGSGQNFDILGQIAEDDDEDREEIEEGGEEDDNEEEGRDSGAAESGSSSRNPSDESVLDRTHLTRPRMSLNTETSEQESTSNKSSRRTSDESDCQLPIRPQPRSYFQNLPPPRHLKAPKPLCRTESKTRADYLLRMMSSPELFNADAINSNTPPQKRSPTGRKISTDVQVGGFLDVLSAPRRRSWRSEEERRGTYQETEETDETKSDQSQSSETNTRLYVNLPERSNIYDYGRGGGSSQNKNIEVRVSSCPETTPL